MTAEHKSMPLRVKTDAAATVLRRPRPLTLEQFRRKYSDRKDGFKYEFNNGEVEKTTRKMKIKQYHIVKNLTRRFTQTEAYAKGDELGSEVEQLTSIEQMRIPDLCLIPAQKLKSNDETISSFAIEITSPIDKAEDIERKRREYFRAGVQVVWQIAPGDRTVSVFTSPTSVTICEGGVVCSAAPALPDFEMTADEVFREA